MCFGWEFVCPIYRELTDLDTVFYVKCLELISNGS